MSDSKKDVGSPEWPKERITQFLEEEGLGRQWVDLPHGLSIAGKKRSRLCDIAFGGSMAGKTVLDVGSYLGGFCIEAMRRGAANAVGIDVDPERIRQANVIASIWGFDIEYMVADLDDINFDREFDISLCFNVLHHLRDPVKMLHKLSESTKMRLVLEVASFGAHDRKTTKLPLFVAKMLGRHETIYVADGSPASENKRFFFSPSAVCRILSCHMKRFWEVELFQNDRERYIIKAEKLSIENLTIVAGPSGAGKTTFISELMDNKYDNILGSGVASNSTYVTAKKLGMMNLSEIFSTNPVEKAVLHYETTRYIASNLHGFSRDITLDIVNCAKSVNFLIIAPRASTLINQMSKAKPVNKGDKHNKARGAIMNFYSKQGWLREHYSEWFDFCMNTTPLQKRFFAFVEIGDQRELREIAGKDELLQFLE